MQHGVLTWCFVQALQKLENDCTHCELLEATKGHLRKLKDGDGSCMDQEVLLTFSKPLSNPSKMRVFQGIQRPGLSSGRSTSQDNSSNQASCQLSRDSKCSSEVLVSSPMVLARPPSADLSPTKARPDSLPCGTIGDMDPLEFTEEQHHHVQSPLRVPSLPHTQSAPATRLTTLEAESQCASERAAVTNPRQEAQCVRQAARPTETAIWDIGSWGYGSATPEAACPSAASHTKPSSELASSDCGSPMPRTMAPSADRLGDALASFAIIAQGAQATGPAIQIGKLDISMPSLLSGPLAPLNLTTIKRLAFGHVLPFSGENVSRIDRSLDAFQSQGPSLDVAAGCAAKQMNL